MTSSQSKDAFFEDVEKIIWGGSSSGKVNALLAAEKAGTLRAATEGSDVDSRKTSEDWQKWKDKTKEDIKVKAVGCLNELNTAAERLRTAAAGSGVANDVQSAIDAAQDQIELLLSEASGVVDDLTGQAGRKSKQIPLATNILLEDTDGCGSPLLLLTCSSDDDIAF